MRIIYKTDILDPDDGMENTVSVIIPSTNWISPSTITDAVPDGKKFKDLVGDEISVAMEELAQKDVPTGLKYKIVADDYIPTDRSLRNSWEIAESELTDGVGA